MTDQRRSSLCSSNVHEAMDTSTSSPSSPMISQRIVTADFYTSPPNYMFDHVRNEFTGSKLNWVPIIRIYGATVTGQKALAHIHGVFPYIYVQADSNDPNNHDELFGLAISLDESICRALGKQQFQPPRRDDNKVTCQHVVKITPVKGRSFYGYHGKEEVFYKIHFYSAYAATKAADILLNAGVSGKKYQPFESHIPFIQQFFIDYNLFGMNLIHYDNVLFRRRGENDVTNNVNQNFENLVQRGSVQNEFPEYSNINTVMNNKKRYKSYWKYSEIPEDLFQPSAVKRMSRCELEFDVLADDILNRKEKRPRNSNPGIIAIWQDEIERRRLNNIENYAEIPIPSSQDRIYSGDIFEAEELYQTQLRQKLADITFDEISSQPSVISENIRPSSQSDSFLPQNLSDIDLELSILQENQSQNDTFHDDDYVINLLQDIAKDNVTENEDDLDDSILGGSQSQDYNKTEIRVKTEFPVPDNVKDVDDDDQEKLEEDVEIWSESFISSTYNDFEIVNSQDDGNFMDSCSSSSASNQNNNSCQSVVPENIKPMEISQENDKEEQQVETPNEREEELQLPSARCRTKDVLVETGKIEKRLKNDQILEQHNHKIIFQLENESEKNTEDDDSMFDISDSSCSPTEQQFESSQEFSETPETVLDVTSYGKVTKSSSGKTQSQAQLLFPHLLQRYPKEIIKIFSNSDPDNLKKNAENSSLAVTTTITGKKSINENTSNSSSSSMKTNQNKSSSNSISLNSKSKTASTTTKLTSKPTLNHESTSDKNKKEHLTTLSKKKESLTRLERIKQAVLNRSSPTSTKSTLLLQQQQQESQKSFNHVGIQAEPEYNEFGVQIQPDVKDASVQLEYPQTKDSQIQTDPEIVDNKNKIIKNTIPKVTFWCTSSTQTDNFLSNINNDNNSSSLVPKGKPCTCKCSCGATSSNSSSSSLMSSSPGTTTHPPFSSFPLTTNQHHRKFRTGINSYDMTNNSPTNINSNNLRGKEKPIQLTPTRSSSSSSSSNLFNLNCASSNFQGITIEPSQLQQKLVRTPEYFHLNSRKQNIKDSRLLELLSPQSTHQQEQQQNLEINDMNDNSGSLVGHMLREKFKNSTSTRDKELEMALGTTGNLEFMQVHYEKTPDLSIESIYEYQSPETDDSILKRIAAAHEGLTLFEWQKKRAEDRTRARNEKRKQLETENDVDSNDCPIFSLQFEPMKQTPDEIESYATNSICTPSENIGANHHHHNNNKIYYHVNMSDDDDDNEIEYQKNIPNVCHFNGGNLSDDENSDDNDGYNSSQSQSVHENSATPPSNKNRAAAATVGSSSSLASQTPQTPRNYVLESKNLARGYKTPQVISQSSSEHTPKSILKKRKRLSNPTLHKRKIKWGMDSTDTSTSDSKKSKTNDDNNDDLSVISLTSTSTNTSTLKALSPNTKNVPSTAKGNQSNTSHSNSWSFYNPEASELDGPTPLHPYNAKLNLSNLQQAKAVHQSQYITTIALEVFCAKRKSLRPDPQFDEIIGIFYSIHVDEPQQKSQQTLHNEIELHVLAVDVNLCGVATEKPSPYSFSQYYSNVTFKYFPDEISMINYFVEIIQNEDPDILVGYEIRYGSWGYFLERGVRLGMPMIDLISRILPMPKSNKNSETSNTIIEWNEMIRGRIVLNLWRLLRHEMTVQSYTFESAMFNIMHEKVSRVALGALQYFWRRKMQRYKTIDYYCKRVSGVMEIIDKLDLINRTSELARLFGIQFFEVFSRGSQFRVESMMLRLTKSDNLIAASPTPLQRAKMRAPTELPLIMEPYSKYYKDPVAVLDFQSLYPSIIIAYNYDFSTCLGRVEHLGKDGKIELGCLSLEVSPFELKQFVDKGEVHISPTGVAFLKPTVRKGILPEMLQQILDTRLMVKRSMKANGNENVTLQKVLDSRQLGLKLIANVTYGYTSANFSGRMPCVEIADSVVSKGRETLERAIKLVQMNESRWGAKVIYGDTDSMFLLFPGCSRQVAFDLAQDIADEVTRLNPKPVKLKLEKVYQPCILQTKKRYVGFSYESPSQKVPKYDAKGIETVRRDGCPAIAKILEKSLRILFKYDDIPRLKQYIQVQFQKIFLGRISVSDYTFAREFRGRAGYRTMVPSLSIAQRLSAKDPRAEPQPQERVPYLIVYGGPNQTLLQQVRTPFEFAKNPNLRINAMYYIERAIIPALERCFKLANINVKEWYSEIPRKYLRILPYESNKQVKRKDTLDWYVISKNCLVCDGKTDSILCTDCLNDYSCMIKLEKMATNITEKINATLQTCEACMSGICVSLDCHTWQKTVRLKREVQSTMVSLQNALKIYHSRTP